MKIITCIVVAATLCCTQALSQPNGTKVVESKTMFATNLCMAKGGIGIIAKGFHVDLKSAKNELILSSGERWTGQSAVTPEVAFFFEGRVSVPQILPSGFDLAKAVLVSFESDKVRFFDFATMSGGYYKRSEHK